MNISSSACIKDVQRLIGRVVALSRFISRSTDKCHLFFATLCKLKQFEWTLACEEALQQLKRYFTSPLLLSMPKVGERLFIYLVVSKTTIFVVLVREEDGRKLPVYYVNKSLLDTETCYSQLEKLAHALITATRKLRAYFQCHLIIFFTTLPMKKILRKH